MTWLNFQVSVSHVNLIEPQLPTKWPVSPVQLPLNKVPTQPEENGGGDSSE